MTEERDASELDRLVDNIMAELDAQESEVYSKEVVAEFRNPANVGPLEDADGMGIADGLCMDSMEIWIKIDDGMISQCSFYTDGCGATIACGSRLTRMVAGKSVEQAKTLRAEELDAALGGLPEDHKHCANLAIIALKNAIRDHERRSSRKRGE